MSDASLADSSSPTSGQPSNRAKGEGGGAGGQSADKLNKQIKELKEANVNYSAKVRVFAFDHKF
jgi:hypothetical protein